MAAAEPGSLRERVGTAVDALEGLRGDYARQERQRNRAVIVALAIAIVAVLVAASGVRDAHSASRDAHRARLEAVHASKSLATFKVQQAEIRSAACLQYNRDAKRQVNAEKAEVRTLLTAALAAFPNTTPAEGKRFLAAVLAAYDRTVDASHPRRDCTPAGIAAYLGQSP